jgi:hypothetical protein
VVLPDEIVHEYLFLVTDIICNFALLHSGHGLSEALKSMKNFKTRSITLIQMSYYIMSYYIYDHHELSISCARAHAYDACSHISMRSIVIIVWQHTHLAAFSCHIANVSGVAAMRPYLQIKMQSLQTVHGCFTYVLQCLKRVEQ